MLRFGLVLGGILLIVCAAVWHDALAAFLRDPTAVLREIYWQRTKGAREGADQVLLTYLAYAFVSPGFTEVSIPEGTMLDFRRLVYAPMELVALGVWLAFLSVGSVAGLVQRETRWIAGGLAAALAGNLLFHLDFQFRGSLYLYAGRMHFLVFALAAGLAAQVRGQPVGSRIYVGVTLGLAVLVGTTNLGRAVWFVTAFDHVAPDCAPRCGPL